MAVAVPALPLAPAPGRMYVDFEERLDFGRLRQYRLDRAKPPWKMPGWARCWSSTTTTSGT